MKKVKYTIALCALLVPGMAMAVNFTWVNWQADQNWADGGNWNQLGAVPTAADDTHFNQGAGVAGAVVSTPGATAFGLVMDNVSSLSIATGGTLTLSGQGNIANSAASVGNAISVDGGTFNSQAIALGIAGEASLTVNSGTYNQAGAWLIAGYGAGATGTLNVNGGTMNGTLLLLGNGGTGNGTVTGGAISLSSQLQIAVGAGSAGHLVMDGGTLTGVGMNFGNGGTAVVDLNGGQLINNGGTAINGNATINVGAGEWIFTASSVADVNWMIDNSGATWNFAGANGNVRSVTDDGLGNVTVTAIPEPATMGLMALFGGALLRFRRMFRL
ncbi:MAG: hypothetical protein DRP64_07855 [Verrucomicrobia bacterium]|nr:MAG: hypothetical protein DRP64_07855 [Verrucomicrobiota bacterium]